MRAASARRQLLLLSGTILALTHASAGMAAETLAAQMQSGQFPTEQVFVFLFLMLGPLKIIGPFARITRGADATLIRQIAGRATLASCIALVIAALVGQSQLNSYGIPVPVLALAAGIILFLVALIDILHQFSQQQDETGGVPALPTLRMAITPLAFPTIITPYGVATFVVLLAITPNRESQLAIAALAALVMLLNLVVMLTSRHMMPVLAMVLPILGGVFGVIQVALGLFIIENSLHAMSLL